MYFSVVSVSGSIRALGRAQADAAAPGLSGLASGAAEP